MRSDQRKLLIMNRFDEKLAPYACNSCGGPVKIIACIDDPLVIEKIRTHL
jgi:hypothetical protein